MMKTLKELLADARVEMGEETFQRFLDDAAGRKPVCDHNAYKSFDEHGRCCPTCGKFLVDWGD
jgi:hypothetical protein